MLLRNNSHNKPIFSADSDFNLKSVLEHLKCPFYENLIQQDLLLRNISYNVYFAILLSLVVSSLVLFT